ncbi:RNA polymerase sigma factor [Larkinella humicola]|uniref:Sigma-70 family RNA polymerase sigma factor n=1 Tax=Larkinella humicola TaxID=2607654 RepID=A0A5N1J5P3_9BACT|nr:sigma-70 family RNA polymerase sigma factor [Larkinella humicola]KAA9340399.1 sigma-70 family RNA polymerase sigma factor [Larkinella humicola]
MATDLDTPCARFDQENLAFYQALLADQTQAWECLYIRSYRVFIPYASQRSSISTDDALDILQDGLAEFALKLKNGKYVFQGKAVTAYVFTVCRNRWVNFLKKNRIRKLDAGTEAVAEENDFIWNEPNPFLSTYLENSEDDLPENENRENPAERDALWEDSETDWEAVGRSFAEVGEDCRAMLHCFYVEEKSLAECGARIGLQENSAKVKRFRCAQRMKALYTQYKRE